MTLRLLTMYDAGPRRDAHGHVLPSRIEWRECLYVCCDAALLPTDLTQRDCVGLADEVGSQVTKMHSFK